MKRNEAQRKYFTLIELLVVIAIIAILASILMPALGKARDKVKSVDCLNNLKTQGTGFQLYASDFSDCIALPLAPTSAIDTDIYNGNVNTNRGWDAQIAVYFVTGYTNPTDWPSSFRPLSKWRIFLCPMDSAGPTIVSGGTQRPRLSYAETLGLVKSTSEYGFKMSDAQIGSPSSCLSVLDNDEKKTDYATSWVGASAGGGLAFLLNSASSIYPIRHSYGGNALFLDGHAGRVAPAGLAASGVNYSLRSKLQYNY